MNIGCSERETETGKTCKMKQYLLLLTFNKQFYSFVIHSCRNEWIVFFRSRYTIFSFFTLVSENKCTWSRPQILQSKMFKYWMPYLPVAIDTFTKLQNPFEDHRWNSCKVNLFLTVWNFMYNSISVIFLICILFLCWHIEKKDTKPRLDIMRKFICCLWWLNQNWKISVGGSKLNHDETASQDQVKISHWSFVGWLISGSWVRNCFTYFIPISFYWCKQSTIFAFHIVFYIICKFT